MWNLTKSTMLTIKGKDYHREFELLGDVEKVRWYEITMLQLGSMEPEVSETEIYDQDELDELELAYEARLVAEMFPTQTII